MSQGPLHLLCVEPRFPGRLGAVADWLVRRRGYRCQFFCTAADAREQWPEATGRGLDVIQFPVGGPAVETAVDWTRFLERGLAYAYGCWECLEARRPRPVDLVVGRTAGLGSTLFVPVYLPGVPIVNLFDYFYHPHANDLAEEAEPTTTPAYFYWRRAANAMDLLDLENGVTPWTPTRWQRDLYPKEYGEEFLVVHDGVNTDRFVRSSGPRGGPRTIAGRTVGPEVRIVSFVARALDRLRGFDRFLQLANRLLRARTDVVCVVLGGPVVQRGLDIEFYNRDYRAQVLTQTPPHDPGRLWFFDEARPAVVAELLAASDLHVYPGRSYPVARSLLEALSAGCVVLAADTPPVREIVTNGRTGLLLPAADLDDWERQALKVLKDPESHRPLGQAAAEHIRRYYAQDITLPLLAEQFARLAELRG